MLKVKIGSVRVYTILFPAPLLSILYININHKLFCIILGLGQVKTITRPSAAAETD